MKKINQKLHTICYLIIFITIAVNSTTQDKFNLLERNGVISRNGNQGKMLGKQHGFERSSNSGTIQPLEGHQSTTDPLSQSSMTLPTANRPNLAYRRYLSSQQEINRSQKNRSQNNDIPNSLITTQSSTYSQGNYTTTLLSIPNCYQMSNNGQCLNCNPGYQINSQGICILSGNNQGGNTLPLVISDSGVGNVGGNGQMAMDQDDQYHQMSFSSSPSSSFGGGMSFNQNGPFVPLAPLAPLPPLTPLIPIAPQIPQTQQTQQTQQIPQTQQTQQTQQIPQSPLRTILDPNCYQYSGTQCIQCSNRYFFGINGQCISVNPQCQTYDSNSGNCTSCYQGYYISNGSCVIGQFNDKNCQTYSQQLSTCIQCYGGYYVDQGSGICVKNSQLCNQTNLNTGACISCFPGYSLNINTGICERSVADPNCLTWMQNNTCLTCSSGYIFNSQGICTTVNTLCKDYDINTGACLTCYDGYIISGVNCVRGSSSPAPDPNCQISSGFSCQQCFNGFYIDQGGVCQLSNPICKTINQLTGECTSCYQGYVISVGNCVLGQGVYPGPVQVDPQPSMPNTIQSAAQNVKIISSDINCISYNNNGINCSRCRDGYYLLSSHNICNQVDRDCINFNYDTLTCISCKIGKKINGASCL